MKSKIFRWCATLIIIIIFAVWSSFYGLHCCLPEAGATPTLYASQADDNLQKTFLKAIDSAKSSITLYIYSLSDERIIQALKKKEHEGLDVQVIHDPSTGQKGFARLANAKPLKMRGLMHKKILIIDEKMVLIGSANFTSESLRLHDNLVVGSISPELSATILANKQHHHFTIGGQMAEFWSLPESAKEGLERLITLIDQAQSSIKVGMFTWTHPDLTAAILAAANRGVDVQIAVDRAQTKGVNKKEIAKLVNSPAHVRINRGQELFHHKFLIVDDEILVNGSANWTRSAFGRNGDCFLILHNLTEEQQKKLQRLWHIIRATSAYEKHLVVLRQGPRGIFYEQFESICMAA